MVVMIVHAPSVIECIHVAGRKRGLNQGMSAIYTSVEEAHGGSFRSRPDCPLRKRLNPFVLVAPNIVGKKNGCIISASQFGDGVRCEQHKFDCCAACENRHNYDLRKV